ncbi:MAG TPA: hypothetical protein EYO65_06245 [Nitrospirales bacterium]|nr:hypothetical protein [Nitrospirales bacterium]
MRIRRSKGSRAIGLFALIALLLSSHASFAGGPFVIDSAGQPAVWSTAHSVPFHTDLGPLGLLTNAEAIALVEEALQVWEDVPSSSITFAAAGSLPFDVTGSNVFDILDVLGDGISPVVFDHDGSVIDAVFGIGASRSVLGFTAIEFGQSDRILEAQAVLNGSVLDGDPTNPDVSRESFLATIVHEFGHYMNLDHSQINGELAFDGDVSNDDGLPTMFPIASDSATKTTLHLDDIATVSTLYPGQNFSTSTGSIEGEIVLGNGTTPFQGANVIARRTGDPIHDAVSYVSGALFSNTFGGGSSDPAFKGLYTIAGLPPGDYTVEVEQIDPTFTGGSSLNPLDPPAMLPGPEEFYNGENEAGSMGLDDPSEATTITVAAGAIVDGIDILFNTIAADDSDIGLALVLTKFKHKIRAIGDRITAKLRVTNVGGVVLTGPTSIQMWISSDDILDPNSDDLVAMAEIQAGDFPLGKSVNVKLKPQGLASVDGTFAIFVIESADESEQQAALENRVLQDIGGRGCVKDSFRLEQESNNTVTQAQSLGKIGLNECVTVTGVLTNNKTGVVRDEDVFQLTVKQPTTLEIILTHDAADNFDAFVFGPTGQAGLCTEMAGEETCSFLVLDGENIPLDIIISPFVGVGTYTLDVQTTVVEEAEVEINVFPLP